MADDADIMIRLFGTIVRGKFAFTKEPILDKEQVKGHQMVFKEKVQATFIVYR